MKKIYVLVIFTNLFSILGFSQTNPTPLTLPVSINFGTTSFTPPFAGMVAWTGSGTRPYTTQAAAEASLSGADMLAATLFTTTPASGGGAGQYGHAVAGDGRLSILQSGNATNGTSQTALAINTASLTNISVSYSLFLSVPNAKDIGTVLQYRVGTSGSFTTVPTTAVTYNSGTTNGGDLDGNTDNDSYTVVLPAAAEGNAVVQLRWITWRGAQAGNSSGIGLDNISITGTPGGGPDTTPPAVSSLTPADNATNVSTATNLQVTFNEPVVKGTGNILVKRLSDGSTFQTIDVTSAAVTVSSSTATITINPLLNATDYYIEIVAGVFTDIALNSFAGISGSTTWNFTTVPAPAAGIIGNNYGFTNCSTTFINEGWSLFSVTGAATWACSTTGRTDAFGVQMNAFVAANNNPLNEDWLISPAFDLTAASLPALRFYSRGDFNGNSLQLRASTNYVYGSDPNTATWTTLNGSFPANVSGTGTWTLSDNIDLSAFNTTNVRLAWVYINPTTAASSRWTIDDVTVFTNVILPACVEPTDQPTNLVLTATANNVTGSFTILPSPTTVENYLVVRSLTTPLTQLPVDATTYTAGQVIGGGNGTVISISTDGTFTDNTTAPSTQYYYFVFAMEDKACIGGPNYNQLNPLTNTVTTPALAPCTTPIAPTVLLLTPGNTSVSGSFTASGSSKYLVLISTTTPLNTTPSNTVTYTVGQTIGNGTVVSYSATTLFTATGLTVATPYYFYVFAANDACTGAPVYSSISLDGTTTTTNNPTGIPPGYYDNVTNQTCSALKTVLFDIIKPTTPNPNPTYDGICTMYPSTDFKVSDFSSNNVIWDMYSDNPTGPDPYEFEYQIDVDGCGGSGANNPPISGTLEGRLYNREHSFPRSWFGGAVEPMNSDIMHIYPTDKEVNNRRSSFPYGKVTSPTFTSLNGSKLGPNSTAGYGGTVFEPIDTYKGDFARAQFYMITAYEDKVAAWQPNRTEIFNGDAYTGFDDWYLLLMYQWHIADPVSPKEISRNNAAYLIQGNRNPYIDHPEYVIAVFQCASVLPVLLENFTAKLNDRTVGLKWKVSNEISFKKYEIQRSVDGNNFNKIGEVAASNLSNYSFTDGNLPNASLVYYRLKLIDVDGKFTNSNIVAVKLNKNLSDALVYPNPTIGALNIKLYEPLFTSSTLQVFDVTGRMVKQQNVSANNLNLQIDVKDLSAGRYFIKIANSKQVINQSFVVVK